MAQLPLSCATLKGIANQSGVTVNLYKPCEHPIQEPDLESREKLMFFNPYQFAVIEGCREDDEDLNNMAILSSN